MLYWCSNFVLQDYAILVDTPGVGEREEVTKKLVDYMQEAIAFIYVINLANAGGVQRDRVKVLQIYCPALNCGF